MCIRDSLHIAHILIAVQLHHWQFWIQVAPMGIQRCLHLGQQRRRLPTGLGVLVPVVEEQKQC